MVSSNMGLTLTLDDGQWLTIRDQIRAEHGDSMILLREKMKRELGFTVRTHSYWDYTIDMHKQDTRIDFYNETAATYFRLKYL